MTCALPIFTGEEIGFAIEQLWQAGALDVFSVAIQMKKNRPGTLLSVIANPEDTQRLEEVMFQHTRTLGIRKSTHDRSILVRREVQVDTPWGTVVCKEVIYPDGTRGLSPEYEDCRKIAIEHGLNLADIVRTVEKAGKN